MRIIGLLITILLMQNCSNNADTKRTNDNSQMTKDELYFDMAKNQIEMSLKDKVIFDKSQSDNGNWMITFGDDTTNTEPDDIVKEYYDLERESLIKGDLNNDNVEDFAIRSVWGLEMGNMFGLTWYIFIKTNDKWITIDNKFGGGKFSDIENIKSINKGKIETSLQKLDEETFLHNDSAIIKYYRIENDSIILVK